MRMMQNIEKIQANYEKIEKAILMLQSELESEYLDALIETMDNLLDDKKVHVENGKPTEKVAKELEQLYVEVSLEELTAEQKRQLMQLLILKAYSVEKIQANHQMTPDTIGILVSYLIQKFAQNKNQIEILDLGVGTANLLSTVMNRIHDKEVHGYGVDNDDTLLALASISAELQQSNIELYHQDALDDLMMPDVDFVVSDLPVGYYPLDERAQQFETHNEKGHSFAHYLLIERAMQKLKEDGLGVFVVPKGMFEKENAMNLLKHIQKQGHLQSLLNLPSDLFSNKNSMKSILVIQKKGPKAKQAKEVLVGEIPSFKQRKEFSDFLTEIDRWVNSSIKL